MLKRASIVTVTFMAALSLATPAAHAGGCESGGFAVGGVCCAYNPWAGSFVATIPQPGGAPIYVGDCNGGVRTPPQYNYGRGPGQ